MQTIMLQIQYQLHLKPFISTASTLLELWNLSIYLYLSYLMLEFTDFVSHKITEQAGTYFLYGTLVGVAVALSFFIVPALGIILMHWKKM